jgi:DNA-binding transcriptional regulator YiaG
MRRLQPPSKTPRDHRPRMPEVALRKSRRMAWCVRSMNALRELRRSADLGQRELAALLSVPVETLRTWDSGRRAVPITVMRRAVEAVANYAQKQKLLSLDQLAKELGVHIRTLQAAARTGRLDAHFSVRSAFGRPIRSASRAAGERFLARHYRRFSGQEICPLPLPVVPNDYDQYVRRLRSRLGLTQHALAQKLGAAGKAVVYQWESRKRTPSPVLWQRLLALKHWRPA